MGFGAVVVGAGVEPPLRSLRRMNSRHAATPYDPLAGGFGASLRFFHVLIDWRLTLRIMTVPRQLKSPTSIKRWGSFAKVFPRLPWGAGGEKSPWGFREKQSGSSCLSSAGFGAQPNDSWRVTRHAILASSRRRFRLPSSPAGSPR